MGIAEATHLTLLSNLRPDITRPQIIVFSGALFDPEDVVEVRRLPAEKVSTNLRPFSTWHKAWSVHEEAGRLIADNRRGYNIYAGANPRPRFGARRNHSIGMARTVFADYDHTLVEVARRRMWSFGLAAPSLLLASGHGAHAYWRLTLPTTDMQAWSEFQKDLAEAQAGDPVVHNAERVMRLPGFVNHKEPAAMAELVEADATRRHDWSALRNLIPVAGRPGPSPHVPHGRHAIRICRDTRTCGSSGPYGVSSLTGARSTAGTTRRSGSHSNSATTV